MIIISSTNWFNTFCFFNRKINKPDSSDDIDSIGNKLYGIVHELYPVFAANVTGMLLEMDINRLHNLLNDNNDELMKCIHEAARVYMESQTKNSNLRLVFCFLQNGNINLH